VRHALDEAKRTVGLAGKHVIEVGGAVPERAALGTGASTWRAGFLNAPSFASDDGRYRIEHADARALPYADASCDVVFSSCAFEHVNDMDRALAEIARVLRPGGAVVTLFAPIWSCAVGHHLWLEDDDGRQLSFMDRVVPDWGHLLLEERELAWFLSLARTPRFALRAAAQIAHAPHVNRVLEAEFRHEFAEAGFGASGLVHMDPWVETPAPSPALQAALAERFPSGGDFHVPGFRGVLVHAGAALAEARR
jgi:SAM-dependent methyltransferase